MSSHVPDANPDVGQAHLFEPPAPTTLTLAERFLVPPFTVLDARAGYWRERKQEWLNLGIEPELGVGREMAGLVRDGALEAEEVPGGIRSEEGRGDRLLSGATPREGYGGDYDLSKGQNAWGGSGTSVFDPVLCELAYRWFSPPDGKVLDPFAGGSVRGIVAAALERRYLGIDLRPEQLEANRAQAQRIGAALGWKGYWPEWVEGDAAECERLAGEAAPFDFILTCPPYFDLEVYSERERDLSAAKSYRAFQEMYYECVQAAARLLKPDRFVVYVVGEVRDNKGAGHLHGLVHDTISAHQLAGCQWYNDGILVTPTGSLPIRASRTFGPGRKLGRAHQYVLVFVKGDARKAAEACGVTLEVALEQGGAVWRSDGSVEDPTSGERVAFTGEEPS